MTKQEILASSDKLQHLFENKFVQDRKFAQDTGWLDYCDEHKIILSSPAEMGDHFNLNSDEYVCLDNPDEYDEEFIWILVPLSFAEKALILGSLP